MSERCPTDALALCSSESRHHADGRRRRAVTWFSLGLLRAQPGTSWAVVTNALMLAQHSVQLRSTPPGCPQSKRANVMARSIPLWISSRKKRWNGGGPNCFQGPARSRSQRLRASRPKSRLWPAFWRSWSQSANQVRAPAAHRTISRTPGRNGRQWPKKEEGWSRDGKTERTIPSQRAPIGNTRGGE
jgi:hypothetical protein